jgi:hypothetical protein
MVCSAATGHRLESREVRPNKEYGRDHRGCVEDIVLFRGRPSLHYAGQGPAPFLVPQRLSPTVPAGALAIVAPSCL